MREAGDDVGSVSETLCCRDCFQNEAVMAESANEKENGVLGVAFR